VEHPAVCQHRDTRRQSRQRGRFGAIFGVFGALLAYLLVQKNEVPGTVLKSLMKMGVSLVAYNLLFGFMLPGIDNAAHLGGVVSGFLLGLVMARPLNLNQRKLQASKRLGIGILGSILLIVLACIALPKSAYSYKGEVAFGDVARAFSPKEHEAITELNDLFARLRKGDVTQTVMSDKLESDCLTIWRDFNSRFSAVSLTDRSPSFRMRNLAVDYTKTKFEDVAKDVDVVLDPVGKETLARSYGVVKKGGIVMSLVARPDPIELKKHEIHGAGISSHSDAEDLAEIAQLIDAGKIKPMVTQVLPLSEAIAAQQQAATHHTRGKVVLRIADDPKS